MSRFRFASRFLSLILLGARTAGAVDTAPVGGQPIHLDVTETASVLYNVDNRNSDQASVASHVDDDWGVYYNRLNALASYGHFHAGLRLDSAWFFTAKTPTEVALELLREQHGGTLPATYTPEDANSFVENTTETSRELATRYTSWLYPSKYYMGYTSRYLDVTAGDFSAQFGRGLVLSVRQQDALASDTTVRGGRLTGRFRVDSTRFKLTVLGGTMNPLRVDEASGRYLGVTSSVTRGIAGITEAGMPPAQASPFDAAATPTYSPDRLAGAQIEGGTDDLLVGVQGSLLGRTLLDGPSGMPMPLSPGVVRSADTVRTGSVSLSAPNLGGHGALYVEAALQGLSYPAQVAASSGLPAAGHAIYASLSGQFAPVTVTAEFKDYRRFFPLLANVDLAHAPEFSAVQYSAPPTTEALWVDTEYEGFNTCVTGGRMRADFELSRQTSVFGWVGRYSSWAESVSNEGCDANTQSEDRVWDVATGLQMSSKDHRSHSTVTSGVRFDDAARLLTDASGAQTHIFYREEYVRHDLVQWLGGPFTAKLQGYARRRYFTQEGLATPWMEIQELLAVEYDGKLTVGTGFDYTGDPQFPPTYFNGLVHYNLSSSSSLSFFAGQRRGGLLCVSGVCRVYAPFEGARLDATVRF